MPRDGRWAYLVPALAGFIVSSGIFVEGDALAALPHAGVLLLSLVSFLRPTVIGWVGLTLAVLSYLGLAMWGFVQFRFLDWLGITLIGILPMMALWSVRPRRPATLA
jgi:hypothetical protein